MKKDKKEKMNKIDKSELIITITVLILAIVIGFFAGKALFESLYGNV